MFLAKASLASFFFYSLTKENSMIHGIYLKSKPKNKWYLVSLAISAEAANLELETFKNKAIKEGNERAEVAVQVFDSLFWVPEYVMEIKEQKPQFN
ncbi:MAG: hypothetical protein ACREBJ_05610 [Nitrosotalea sp.]